jgi:PAS domain S-box-containing protein
VSISFAHDSLDESQDIRPVVRTRGLRPLTRFDWLTPAVHSIAWALAAGFAFRSAGREVGLAIGTLGLASLAAIIAIQNWTERRRWVAPIHDLLGQVAGADDSPEQLSIHPAHPEVLELARVIREIKGKLVSMREAGQTRLEIDSPFAPSGEFDVPKSALNAMLSKSMLVDPSGGPEVEGGDPEPGEMINRLELKTLRWLDCTPSVPVFLGWTLEELRERSLLDVVDPEDRELARSQLDAAIAKGEGHNLLYRIRNAGGEARAIELHVAVRYSSTDARPHHVRVRMADMTKKVRAERELRRRTKELIDVNTQLRRINRELEHVKNRYSDLYQNAPAMYFSFDEEGKIVECNDTLLFTLGLDRETVEGQPYTNLLPEARKPAFANWFNELRRTGRVELETRWVKSDGRAIDIWLASTAVHGSDGSFRYSRSVARDVTARRALEAELKDKNDRLALANDELSRKNKELDEFTYIIAHDLKEPIRTLIAFSDFLEKDCGDCLNDPGREYLHHIVEAARRMRSLIHDLQILSRAGRVAGDFGRVKLEPLVEAIRSDFAELLRSRSAEVRIIGELPEVWGDAARIGQLLANLIGNGLKYNQQDHPRVEIEAVSPPPEMTQAGFATLAVRDNGIGIDPKFHAKIFELFRRLHTRDEYDGTGAGLTICQKIVQAHGGRLWVESEPGTGSTFFVNLPLAAERFPLSDPPSHVD